MKILVTGCNGQLGSQIINVLKNNESELGNINEEYKNAEVKGIDIEELDITSINNVKEYLSKQKFDIVINPAAYTDVDGCEKNQELAFKVNSLGARNLAIACELIGSKFIHISTDYVFDGSGIDPYKEYSIPNPVSVYGKTKYLGEEYIRQFSSKYFIIRTAWLYGYNGNNFVKSIVKAAKERGHLEVVNDQMGNPTNAEDLAHHILKIAVTDEYGIYHCTGKGECSWYDFACKIVQYANIYCTISPISSVKLNRIAKRPAYSSLENGMLRCTVGDEMREWEEALKVFIEKLEL